MALQGGLVSDTTWAVFSEQPKKKNSTQTEKCFMRSDLKVRAFLLSKRTRFKRRHTLRKVRLKSLNACSVCAISRFKCNWKCCTNNVQKVSLLLTSQHRSLQNVRRWVVWTYPSVELRCVQGFPLNNPSPEVRRGCKSNKATEIGQQTNGGHDRKL